MEVTGKIIDVRLLVLGLLGFVSFSLFGAPWHLFPVWGVQAGFKYLVVFMAVLYSLDKKMTINRDAAVFIFIVIVMMAAFMLSSLVNGVPGYNKIFRYFDRVFIVLVAFALLSPSGVKELKYILFGVLLGAAGMFVNVLVFGEQTFQGRMSIDGSMTETITIGRTFGAGVVSALCLILLSNSAKEKTIYFVFAFLFLYGAVLSGSRAPLLASIVSAGVAFLLIKNKLGLLFFFGVSSLLLVVILSSYWDDLPRALEFIATDGSTGRNSETRLGLYGMAVAAFADNPFFGIGMDGFYSYSGFAPYAHNIFLEVLSEGGVIAFVPFILSLLFVLRCVVKADEAWVSIIAFVFISYFLVNASISFSLVTNEAFWIACVIFTCLASRAKCH